MYKNNLAGPETGSIFDMKLTLGAGSEQKIMPDPQHCLKEGLRPPQWICWHTLLCLALWPRGCTTPWARGTPTSVSSSAIFITPGYVRERLVGSPSESGAQKNIYIPVRDSGRKSFFIISLKTHSRFQKKFRWQNNRRHIFCALYFWQALGWDLRVKN